MITNLVIYELFGCTKLVELGSRQLVGGWKNPTNRSNRRIFDGMEHNKSYKQPADKVQQIIGMSATLMGSEWYWLILRFGSISTVASYFGSAKKMTLWQSAQTVLYNNLGVALKL